MTEVEKRILSNQIAIMCTLKEILRLADEESEREDRIIDRRWIVNCCKNTLSLLNTDTDTIPDRLDYV